MEEKKARNSSVSQIILEIVAVGITVEKLIPGENLRTMTADFIQPKRFKRHQRIRCVPSICFESNIPEAQNLVLAHDSNTSL